MGGGGAPLSRLMDLTDPGTEEVSWKGLKAPTMPPENLAPLPHPPSLSRRREFAQMHQRLGSGNSTLQIITPGSHAVCGPSRHLRGTVRSFRATATTRSWKKIKTMCELLFGGQTTSGWTMEEHPRKQHQNFQPRWATDSSKELAASVAVCNALRKAPFKFGDVLEHTWSSFQCVRQVNAAQRHESPSRNHDTWISVFQFSVWLSGNHLSSSNGRSFLMVLLRVKSNSKTSMALRVRSLWVIQDCGFNVIRKGINLFWPRRKRNMNPPLGPG